ncbi:MAG: caspase family protein [Pseudomonadota bacterium]
MRDALSRSNRARRAAHARLAQCLRDVLRPLAGWISLIAAAIALTQPGLAQVADGADPVQTPFLELETGTHTARIRDLVADAAGRRFFTISPDRSIRVWAAADGRLLRTLRLPLGPGEIGEPLSLAATPSGEFLFVAARSFDLNGTVHDHSIYVVKPVDGTIPARRQLGNRLGQLSSAQPRAMDLSPGLDHLAIALGEDGLLVLDARTLGDPPVTLYDRVPGEAVLWAEFTQNDRLAAITSTGRIRLYDVDPARGLVLLHDRKLAAGRDPHRIAVSPDGARLAVGFLDSAEVEILSAESLAPLAQLSAPAALRGNLAVVGWLTDADGGVWLAAGGTAKDRQDSVTLLLWPPNDAAPMRVVTGTDSITALHAAGPGSVLLGTGRPLLGRVTVQGAPLVSAETAYLRPAQTLDFRAPRDAAMQISADGTQVTAHTRSGQRVGFDLTALRPIAAMAELPPGSRSARPRDGAITFQNWRGETSPRLAGHALVGRDGQSLLRQNERSLAVDVPPSDLPAVVGADFHLYLVRRDGFEAAALRTRAPVWGVVSTPDGSIIAAVLGDGTLRWYRRGADGLTEIAAVFLHPDGQRWLAWRPDGRFAHSDIGGADLAGFHLNGPRQPFHGSWVPLAAFYAVTYAPQSVANALSQTSSASTGPQGAGFAALLDLPRITPLRFCSQPRGDTAWTTRSLEEDEAIAAPAPDRSAVEPACQEVDVTALGLTGDAADLRGVEVPQDHDALSVTLELAASTGGLDRIEAILNGRLVGVFELTEAQKSAARNAPVQLRVDLPVDAGANGLTFRAYNGAGVYRESAPIYMRSGRAAEASNPSVLYLLGIGIDNYDTGLRDLVYAGRDAASVIDRIRLSAAEAYDKVPEPVLLRDAEATRSDILAALQQIARSADQNDAVVVYFAGHGVADDGGYVFASHDVPGAAPSIVRAHGLTAASLAKALGDIRAKNLLVILDTCYAGGFDVTGPDLLSHQTGRYVITSTAATEEALDHARGTQNGVFAAAMLEALDGKAAIAGQVDVLSLASYMQRRVGEIAAQMRHAQAAVFKAAGEVRRFPLAVAPR